MGGGCSSSIRKKHLSTIQSTNSPMVMTRPRMSPFTFTNEDFKAIDLAHDDLMVITMIDNFAIMQTLVDQGSSVDTPY